MAHADMRGLAFTCINPSALAVVPADPANEAPLAVFDDAGIIRTRVVGGYRQLDFQQPGPDAGDAGRHGVSGIRRFRVYQLAAQLHGEGCVPGHGLGRRIVGLIAWVRQSNLARSA